MNPHFSVPFNFGAIPREECTYKDAKVVILPVPFDATTTYQPGARNGPNAIISASRSVEFFDEELGKETYKVGICTLDELETLDSAEGTVNRVQEAVSALIEDGKKVVLLGGEHSITSGAVAAHLKKYPDLTVLHIDAHADMRDELGGNKFNHGSVARRISEICPIVSVGVRSMGKEEHDFVSGNRNVRLFLAKDIFSSKDDEWMDEVIDCLGENVYVTIDLDAFDSGIMPSVGTPQPGGFSWYQMTRFLKKLSENKKAVGFDVTELMPIPGLHAPDFLAAKLVYKLIGYFY